MRNDFPILQRKLDSGVPIVYLDSGATSLRPTAVQTAMEGYYNQYNANIHRGIYRYAEEATAAYEGARARVASFLNAPSPRSIIFTRNTTESVNLVAYSYGRTFLQPGDVILCTEMEHHANMVPWQVLAKDRSLRLEYVPVQQDGQLDQNRFHELLGLNPKLFAVTYMSNVLGTINPLEKMIEDAHQVGALVLVDAAQSAAHMSLDLQKLKPDFLAFSAHKMCGPTGIGVLYGREDLLEAMPPFLTGGDMIKEVHLRSFTINDLPHKFEAGTPAIAEAIGFGAALDYLEALGMEAIHDHEMALTAYALGMVESIPGMRVLGPGIEDRGGLLAFTMDDAHPHDVAQILDGEGVAVRAGHHCAMPIHEKFRIPASTRASFYMYNTREDVERLFLGLKKVQKLFG
ncbi:MAG: cysteine desulfurase [Anaerolineales bacterium]|nr:cysteine desulfurase [Anaerolineales bacterium]